MSVITNLKKILDGLINDMSLKEYVVASESKDKYYKVFGRSEAQAVRIARRYFEIKGNILIWTSANFDSAVRGTPPNEYSGEGEYFSDVLKDKEEDDTE